jgi:heat shock protein HslJ
MKYLIALAVLLAAACQADETVTAYTDGTRVFTLQSIDGIPFGATATIDLSEAGKITGQAPCNRYFAAQSAPYPWFMAGPIGSTRMACPDLVSETTFFTALELMTLAEVVGDTLILSNDTKSEMVFQAP